MWQLAFLAVLAASAGAQNFSCPDGPQFLVDTLGFPTCADNMDPDYDVCDEPVLPNNICSFSLFSNLTADFGAQLTIYATNLGQNDTITVEGLRDLVTIPRYTGQSLIRGIFPLPGDSSKPFVTITIVASDSSSITFGYYVQKTKVPTVQSPTQLTVGAGQLAQYVVLDNAQPGDSWQITGDTQVALSVATNPPLSLNNFLNIWVYAGIGASKTFLGSLYSAQNQPLLSDGQNITLVYLLEPFNATFQGTVVINENSNLISCSSYLVEYSSSSIMSKQLFNTGNYACYTILKMPEDTAPFYLSGYSDGGDGLNQLQGNPFYVLAGGPLPLQNISSASSLLAIYSNTSMNAMPQLLPGFARTFISPAYRLWLFFARDIYSSKDTEPSFGRNGFIMTSNFPYSMPNQEAHFLLNYTYPFNFTFNVATSFASADAMLTIEGSRTPLIKQRISQMGKNWNSVVDSTIKLTIDQDTGIDGGVYLNYQVIRDVNEPLECPDGNTYVPGDVATQFPLSGVLPSNFKCDFKFVVATSNWYTLVDWVKATNMAPGEHIYIASDFDTVKSSVNTTYFSLENTAFPGQTVTISVKTGDDTKMMLQYQIRAPEWPDLIPSQTIDLSIVEDAYYLQFKTISNLTIWQINAKTSMTMVSALSSFYPATQLLNFFVFEGLGDDMQVVGTLFGTDSKFWASKHGTVTIFFAQPTNILFEGSLVISESKNVAACKFYSALWSNYEFYRNQYIYEYHVSMDAKKGETCLLIVNDFDPTTLAPIDAPIFFGYTTITGNAQPYVIAGAPVGSPNDNFLLGSFVNGTQYPYFNIPQKFDGHSRTIYLNNGTLDFLLSANPGMAPYINVANSRSGFIVTDNYGFSSTEQSGSEVLRASSHFYFNFSVLHSSPLQGAFMSIVSDSDSISVDLSDPQAASQTYRLLGTTVNIQLFGGNTPNRGIYVSYLATPVETIACPTGNVTLTGDGQILRPGALPSNFQCDFKFTLTDNKYYALLDSLHTTNMAPGEFVLIKSDFDTITSSVNSTYFTLENTAFPPQTVTISVKTLDNTKMMLDYKIRALPWPNTWAFQNVNLSTVDDAFYLQFKTISDLKAWNIKATGSTTMVSALSSFYPSTQLLNFFIYEGAGDNSHVVGTLYGTDSGSWASSSNTVTLYFVQLANHLFEGTLVISESQNVADCKSYSAMWSDYEYYRNQYIYEYHVSMEARNGQTCLLIVNDYDFTTMVPVDAPIFFGYTTITSSATPFLIAGAPRPLSDANNYMLGSFVPSDANYFNIPQKFDGHSRTIYLNNGTLDFLLSANPGMAPYINVPNPRTGIILTDNYGFSSAEQKGSEVLRAPEVYGFWFAISAMPVKGALMTVVSDIQNLTLDLSIYTATTQPWYVSGSVLNVNLYGGDEQNSGVFVRYVADYPSNTTTMGPTTILTGPTTTTLTATSQIQNNGTTAAPQPKTAAWAAFGSIFSMILALLLF